MKRLSLLLLLLLARTGWGAVYYVATDGADTNNGTSALTPFAHHPWDVGATNTANSTTLQPGDTVYFKRGQVWYDCYMLIEDSGSLAGGYITNTTLDGFGTGADPILVGSYDPAALSFVADGGSYVETGIAATPVIVAYTGTGYAQQLLTLNSGVGNAVGAGQYDWGAADGGTLWVNVGEDPDSGTIYVAKRDYVVLGISASYVVFSNLDFRCGKGDEGVFYLSACNNVTVQDCASSLGKYAIYLKDASTAVTCTGCTVSKCKTAGIAIIGSDMNIITGSTVTGSSTNGAMTAGIALSGSDSCTISANTVSAVWNGNEYGAGGAGSGIAIASSSNSNLIQRNLLHDNYLGISFTETSGLGGNSAWANILYDHKVNSITVESSGVTNAEQIYHNTIIHNPSDHDVTASVDYSGHGIDIQNPGTKAAFANNVIYVSRAGDGCDNMNGLCVSDTSANIVQVRTDYNLVFGVVGANLFKLNGTQYTTLADWQTAVQADAKVLDLAGVSATAESHSLNADALFVSQAGLDFRLQSRSPCISTGTDVGLTTDYYGQVVPRGPAPDIGAHEYQGQIRVKVGNSPTAFTVYR